MKSSLCIRRAALGGQNILVKYKDGERVVVPEGTPILTFCARDKSELKPGADIIIFGVVKKDDGTPRQCRPQTESRRRCDAKRHPGVMRSIELRCAIAHLRISRFPGVQLHP